MKRLFVDTDILLDLLARREPFYEEAAELFSLADMKHVHLSVSALSISTVHYVLSKSMDAKKAKVVLRKLRLIVKVLPLDERVIDLALNSESFSDFEDSLQSFTALEANQELIVTRNLKDFKGAALPVMTAKQYVQSLS